ncbi:MAG: DUF4398 domain-containing protein [Nitrospirota bacterium]
MKKVILLFFIILIVSAGIATAKDVAPLEKITTVKKAIDTARESNAIINAPLELKLAEDKLEKAKAAINEEEFEMARRLADEALIDAKLAEAKSRSERAKKLEQEMRNSIDTLRRELER